jgi:hypothetical protein
MVQTRAGTITRPDSETTISSQEISIINMSQASAPPNSHAGSDAHASVHVSPHVSPRVSPHGSRAPTPHDNPDDEPDEATKRAMMFLSRTLGEAFATAFAQARTTLAPDPAKYPKAKDPSMFNGRRRKYLRTWIGENEICFRTAPNLYRNDTSKIMFAGSFLEGDAKTWFTDYFKDPANIPAFMSDWTLFEIELQRNFGLEDELGAAEDDLRKLSMSDKDHATYFTARFRAIASNLIGVWDDRNLRNAYYQKLAPRLRAQFVSAGAPVPSRLDPLVALAERFDRAYWSDFELNRSLSSTSTAPTQDASKDRKQSSSGQPAKTPAKAVPANPKPATPSHLTKEGKLTDAERKRRFEAGACLYCGEAGHLAALCPKRATSRIRAAATDTRSAAPTAPEPITPQTARVSVSIRSEGSSDSGND